MLPQELNTEVSHPELHFNHDRESYFHLSFQKQLKHLLSIMLKVQWLYNTFTANLEQVTWKYDGL